LLILEESGEKLMLHYHVKQVDKEKNYGRYYTTHYSMVGGRSYEIDLSDFRLAR
jgi:hypothetical protein